VAHIESGLRSFDESMPEEANRRLTDHLSRILLVHSESGVTNLRAEGIDMSRVHLVGNTMIDSVFRYLPAAEARQPWQRLGVEPHMFGLVTLHRPALVDDEVLLSRTISGLEELAKEVPIVFPVHPRTEARLDSSGLGRERLAEIGIIISGPLGYLEFLGLEAKAQFVLTDSGGIQEETSALGVRCFTLRDTTERPITVDRGTNTMLGLNPDRIGTIPELIRGQEPSCRELPLWDGRAGERAAEVIDAYLPLRMSSA
jgi:UDP-N-acetylglucosamine 2-epimerase (non-hydrolysing)